MTRVSNLQSCLHLEAVLLDTWKAMPKRVISNEKQNSPVCAVCAVCAFASTFSDFPHDFFHLKN